MDHDGLARSALFRGLGPEETAQALQCLGATRRDCAKGETVLRAGAPVRAVGLVLSGSVHIESVDAWGARRILGRAGAGELFAEAYACLPGERLMVDVVAAEPAALLFLDAARLLDGCPRACPFHMRLVRNLLAVAAQKNLELSRRSLHTAPRSIRGRLAAYLSWEAARQGSRRFRIPFDRQELADYLGVDRSALSAELGRMRREGLLAAQRRDFELLALPDDAL